MSLTKDTIKTYSIANIAKLIGTDWGNISVHARPYLIAMLYLESISDKYGADSGTSVVSYFLSNARSYTGETAKLVKAELNRRVKASYKS
jgi:hypothetical protein